MRFLLQFRGRHNDLRLSEFLSVVSLHRNRETTAADLSLQPAHQVLTGHAPSTQPNCGAAGVVLYGEIFFFAELESESEARAIASRTVLLRGIYIPIGHGLDYPSCISTIDTAPFANALDLVRDDITKPSFRCVVDAFGRSLDLDEQLDRIHRFSEILRSFPGKVKLRGAEIDICILEDAFPTQGHGRGHGKPRQVFLARKIAEGQGGIGSEYSLKRRRYIGPTSMDAELAFVMTNMARVGKNDLVLDPFCGTCGVLVACKAVGAHVVGGDINILALRGKGKDVNIEANFRQYGLQGPLGLLRADVMNSAIRETRRGYFDAVVCDPPYGIKEGTRVFREDSIDAGMERNHFQGTERVRFVDFLQGVLEIAVQVLVTGGRLVYWLPTTPEYCEDDVPRHPGLQMVHNCEQPLTMRMSRRLITMVKVSEKQREVNERDLTSKGVERLPAHFDLACKLLRQPERAEARLRTRDPVSL